MSTPSHVCIVGGAGFIGTKITEALLARGDRVLVVDVAAPRITHERLTALTHDFSASELQPQKLEGITAVINLAGVSIGKRWSSAYKKKIYDSRILTTRSLVSTISKMLSKPSVFVQASAVGFYGDRDSELLTEESSAGSDFLAGLCVDWEAEARKTESFGIRFVALRTAHVIGPGGLLATLKPIFSKGLGGYFGNGKQYMPWVHWRDIVGMYLFAIDTQIAGVFNTGAGITPSQKELFSAFARSIGSRFLWRIPYFVALIVFGSFARALVSSQNTDSSKIRNAGYVFERPVLDQALLDS